MSREWFENYMPQADSAAIVRQADKIIDDYLSQGLTLTLRQLYYQFVALDLFPDDRCWTRIESTGKWVRDPNGTKNAEPNYKWLGDIMSKGRLGGLLDWDAVEDRVRQPVVWAEYDSPKAMLEHALRGYRLPRLEGQETYVELWVEKDALAGVLKPIAAEYHVTLMVNRGYSSSSAMKEAGDRIRDKCAKYGVSDAIVFYLGDHDPSGEDMVRDIRDRLGKFLNDGTLITVDRGKVTFEEDDAREERKPYIDLKVTKLALTMEQIRRYNPPPNPAKLSDSRAKAYIAKYGHHSWEVDALPPTVLRDLITEAIENVFDMDKVEAIKERERDHRATLLAAARKLE